MILMTSYNFVHHRLLSVYWNVLSISCGKEYHATHGPIDAVYHTEEYLARLLIPDFDKLLDVVLQTESAFGVGLHKVAGVFVHSQQVVVFVKYISFAKHLFGLFFVWFRV